MQRVFLIAVQERSFAISLMRINLLHPVKQVLTPDKACHRNQTNISLALLASRAQQKADNNNPHKHELRTCFVGDI
jgi:hypothetical protein